MRSSALLSLKAMSPLLKKVSIILLGIFVIVIMSQTHNFEAETSNVITATNDIVKIEENVTAKETSSTVNSSETTNKPPVYYAIYDSHTPNGNS